jgi:hypothetical protein
MTSHFAPKSEFPIDPLPRPSPPPKTPIYPPNLADLNVDELVLLYSQYTQLVAYTGVQSGLIEAEYINVKDEIDRETTLRFVHGDAKSTTERKERAKASKKVMALCSRGSLFNQDLVVLKALLDGYRSCLFSVKHELERRTRYE